MRRMHQSLALVPVLGQKSTYIHVHEHILPTSPHFIVCSIILVGSVIIVLFTNVNASV